MALSQSETFEWLRSRVQEFEAELGAAKTALTDARRQQRELDAKIVAGGFPQEVHAYTEQVLAAIRGEVK